VVVVVVLFAKKNQQMVKDSSRHRKRFLPKRHHTANTWRAQAKDTIEIRTKYFPPYAIVLEGAG
jgi:hypothetical protein